MTHDVYVSRVTALEEQLSAITKEYVDSNKKYNIDDILEISFEFYNKPKLFHCKILNIYPAPTHNFGTNFGNWPKGKLQYFARYYFKNKDGEIILGEVCRLADLSGSNNLCGYHIKGIDLNTVKIKVITENEL